MWTILFEFISARCTGGRHSNRADGFANVLALSFSPRLEAGPEGGAE